MGDVFTKLMIFCFIAAMAATFIGFQKLVWFMSIGYGFAINAIGIILFLTAIFGHANIVTICMCLLLIVYGFRLGVYLYSRETKNQEYQKTLVSTTSGKKVNIVVSIVMWLYCACMYVAQTSPLIYRMTNGDKLDVITVVAMLIMLVGVIGEAVADKQKSAAKAIDPHKVCSTGLFKIVRCPNYFCEMLVWTGVFISGLPVLSGGQWIIAIIGYVLIVIVMISGAQRLEKRHEKNYGNDPEYVKYADSTPILFPIIPLYHLNKIQRGAKHE